MALKQSLCQLILIIALEILVLNFGVTGSSRLDSKHKLPPHKHAVKTIETEYGDIYDCVDFYKQPSLSHPLLRNHTYHPKMGPLSNSQGVKQDYDSPSLSSIEMKDGGCPKGTVPILRMARDGDIRPTWLPHHLANNSSLSWVRPGTDFAIAQSKNDPTKSVYYGVGAVIGVYNPYLDQPSIQYSSGELIIRNGLDSITVGWTVNPSVYKDNRTRLFVYTMVNDKPCFNDNCAFVVTSSTVPPSAIIQPVSKRGGPFYNLNFLVFKDMSEGDWFLQVQGKDVGYWPKKVFTALADAGTYIACGGEVYFPGHGSAPYGPEMGSGYKPTDHLSDSAYCINFVVRNDQGVLVNPDNTEEYLTSADDNYKVWDKGYTGEKLGHVVAFGGPFKV